MNLLKLKKVKMMRRKEKNLCQDWKHNEYWVNKKILSPFSGGNKSLTRSQFSSLISWRFGIFISPIAALLYYAA
jgi:hypothetical protein